MMMLKIVALLAVAVLTNPVYAQMWSVTTPMQYAADPAKGAQLRPQGQELVALVQAGRLDEAEQTSERLCKAYEAIFDKRLQHYIFQTRADYEAFKKTASTPFEWIDWGYKDCFQMQAFILSERQKFAEAVVLLQGLLKLAPYSAEARVEMGSALTRLGRAEEALARYREAYQLADHYSSQQQFLGMALRGIGFSLVELKRLDEAEQAYRQALKVEPTNNLALKELIYIDGLRKGK